MVVVVTVVLMVLIQHVHASFRDVLLILPRGARHISILTMPTYMYSTYGIKNNKANRLRYQYCVYLCFP